jgi:hypothetical protein
MLVEPCRGRTSLVWGYIGEAWRGTFIFRNWRSSAAPAVSMARLSRHLRGRRRAGYSEKKSLPLCSDLCRNLNWGVGWHCTPPAPVAATQEDTAHGS